MNRIALIATALAALVVVGGAAAYMSMSDQIAREDVGDNAALGPVQDQLAGFNGCEIEYRTHHRMSNTLVQLASCGEPRSTAHVTVPADWKFPDLVFEARRDNARRRWRIYVDKSRTSLDTLVAALSKVAPVIVGDGNAQLQKAQAGDRAWRDGEADRDKAAHDQTDQNRASYGK
ncbi:MAG TPA: hypothetical protein VGC42_24810 [Kofleriaceae bacterium]